MRYLKASPKVSFLTTKTRRMWMRTPTVKMTPYHLSRIPATNV